MLKGDLGGFLIFVIYDVIWVTTYIALFPNLPYTMLICKDVSIKLPTVPLDIP